jgi:hypothetical protein
MRTPVDPFDALPEAVLVLDVEHRVLHANDRARVLLGVRADAPGTPLAGLLHLLDESGQHCPDPVPAVRGGARLAEQHLRVRLPDGRERPVTMCGRWQADGGVVLTFRSGGRREAVDAARSDLVAMVAHELRSPLTSVKGFTRALLDRWERFSDVQKRTMLETVNADADRVTRLLQELLEVSRIDAGRVQLRPSLVDVAALVADVVDKARHRPDGSGRTLDVTVADDVPGLLLVDRDKVEQMLTNLVDNALRYAPGSAVRVALRGDGHGVRIDVADDGPGIATDQQRMIFSKFGRGRDVRRSGSGLGLFITRGLARAHGGDVRVSSEPGSGATFTVQLPHGDRTG